MKIAGPSAQGVLDLVALGRKAQKSRAFRKNSKDNEQPMQAQANPSKPEEAQAIPRDSGIPGGRNRNCVSRGGI